MSFYFGMLRIDSNEKIPGLEKREEEKRYVASMKKAPCRGGGLSWSGTFGGVVDLSSPAFGWLPRMDSNHDKVIQNHLCYRYTTRQCICLIIRYLCIVHCGIFKMPRTSIVPYPTREK